MCPDLPDPANGRITFSGDGLAPFVLDTMATYSCEPGYGLNSTNTRTCVDESLQANPVGTWDGEAPTCFGWLITIQRRLKLFMFFYTAIQCPALNDINNGDISYNSGNNAGQFGFNTEATHTCDNGYFLSNGNGVRVCEGNDSSTVGMWRGDIPVCTGESQHWYALYIGIVQKLFYPFFSLVFWLSMQLKFSFQP